MNTVRDLREALAGEVRRLQPPAGLESRVLRQALGAAALPARGATRPWQSRHASVPNGVRFLGATVAVLLVLLIVAGILLGGRILRDRAPVPAHPSTHPVPRAEPGMVTSAAGWRTNTGPVQRTTDGGVHWTNVEPRPYVDSGSSNATYFLDATHAWVTEIEGNGPLLLMTFRTADGAKTWDQGAAITVVGAIEGSRLYFIDPKHGWLLLQVVTIAAPASESPNPDMAEERIYGTRDGGLHWAPVARNLHSKNAECSWEGIAFASLNDGWLALYCPSPDSSPPLLATRDGGVTWTSQELPLAEAGLRCPCAADAPTVFDSANASIVVWDSAGQERFFMTANQGRSWTARTLPGEVQLVIDFIDSNHGWVVAGPSALFTRDPSGALPILPGVTVPLYRTEDGGLTWAPVATNLALSDSNGRLTDLYFVDLEHGFAERYNIATIGREYRQFLSTDDGGRTWRVIWTYA